MGTLRTVGGHGPRTIRELFGPTGARPVHDWGADLEVIPPPPVELGVLVVSGRSSSTVVSGGGVGVAGSGRSSTILREG
jgi:hypothetical protein